MSAGELAASIAAGAALLTAIITMLFSATKVGRMSGIMEQSLVAQNRMIADLKTEIGKLGDVVTKMAVQTTRMDGLTNELSELRTRVNELAHGEGFVFPLNHVRPAES